MALLAWEHFGDEGTWEVFSAHVDHRGNPFRYIIKVCCDGKFDVNYSDSELCNGVAAFETLAAAKSHCESREEELTTIKKGHKHDWRRAFDGTEVCSCGAWQ